MLTLLGGSLPLEHLQGYKYVVHATMQEQWGQGSLVGGRCHWDQTTDSVVSVCLDTDTCSLRWGQSFEHFESFFALHLSC